MNYENIPGQLVALFLGWSFTLFYQNRANRRAEALKRKDKIIDKLEDLSEWLESEISKDRFSAIQTETTYSGMISQIELRIKQLNQHIGRQIYDVSMLSSLREIEILEVTDECLESNNATPYKVRELASDVVEHIESKCDSEFFGRKSLTAILNEYFKALKGAVCVLIFILLFICVYQFCKKYLDLPIGTCVYGQRCELGPVPLDKVFMPKPIILP